MLPTREVGCLPINEFDKQAAGHAFEITLPTGGLAEGVYFYIMEAAGKKTNSRVAVMR